jgi:soluble lytic murein transglycosylase-like protein
MGKRLLAILFGKGPFRVLWLGTITIVCCVAVGLSLAVWILRLQAPIAPSGKRADKASPWGRELKVVQRAFQETRPQEPWSGEELKWFVATNFRSLSPKERAELVRAVQEASNQYGIAPQLIISVIMVESEGDPWLESEKGALGLMQIMPAVGEELAAKISLKWKDRETLTSPATNVKLGAHYLFELLQKYEDLPLALCAYWLGPTRVDQILSRNQEPPWEYVNRVLRVLENL